MKKRLIFKKGKKGFAFILDATLALIILSAFIGLTLSLINEKEINEADAFNKIVIADDTLEVLHKDGTLMSHNTRLISEKINDMLPRNLDWKSEIKKYQFNELTMDFELVETKIFGNQTEDIKDKPTVNAKRYWFSYEAKNIKNYFEITLIVWSK